jgi:hypothetical protein
MELEERAERIPSMGGSKIGHVLREVAAEAATNTAIVEVGCWLGAGTAQLALGTRDREDQESVVLHCYDRWTASPIEVKKAAQAGVALEVGADTLPFTKDALAPFGVQIQFHKGHLFSATWEGGPISVFVDDASKLPRLFHHALFTFGPHWIPGETIVVFMDFHIWKKTHSDNHRCQQRFVEANSECFEVIKYRGRKLTSTFAMFRYVVPIEALSSGSLRDRWRIWLQLCGKSGFVDLVLCGRWRDIVHIFRTWWKQ